jgi:alpha-L-arabinofuranosidase
MLNRRVFLQTTGAGSLAAVAGVGVVNGETLRDGGVAYQEIRIDPAERFEFSPYLYMQFMEPLGATDSSVAAAWDYHRGDWREDVVRATRELAPSLMRWGGNFISYYRWKEAVGPPQRRVPMHNLQWGGMEDNQVGVVEFRRFCDQVGADPLLCVNFESEGRDHWKRSPWGSDRTAGPDEAAEWVDYCNNANNPLRLSHGINDPCRVGLWQIGNETSYDPKGFDVETAARKTVEFAQAMRKVDPTIKIVGWGDSGWAERMLDIAGEELNYLAFHHMWNPHGDESVLHGTAYRDDPDRTWAELMDAYKPHEQRIIAMREERDRTGAPIPLALTECHFALQGRNRGDVLSSWAAGVAMARVLNAHTRHGDVLKIATAADFCGNRWQVNANMIPTPQHLKRGAYLMPVARVMSLYRSHSGRSAVTIAAAPSDLDVTASRTNDRVYLHVVNIKRTRACPVRIAVEGMNIKSGRVHEIAVPPQLEIIETRPHALDPSQRDLPRGGTWTAPPASVSAIELEVASV